MVSTKINCLELKRGIRSPHIEHVTVLLWQDRQACLYKPMRYFTADSVQPVEGFGLSALR
jgi:hypothetical protein